MNVLELLSNGRFADNKSKPVDGTGLGRCVVLHKNRFEYSVRIDLVVFRF